MTLAGGLLATGLAACGDESTAVKATGGTIGNVGELPDLEPSRRTPTVGDTVSVTVSPTTEETTATESTSTTTSPDTPPTIDAPPPTLPDETSTTAAPTVAGQFGATAEGNRLLVVGDSISDAIGPDFGGQLCDDLERRGWFVGVDAVQGRDIDAGLDALRDDLEAEEWGAAIVNLGSNYRDDPAHYAGQLRQILTLLRGRPVLLVTVTEFEDDIAEVNYIIRDSSQGRADVALLEWSERSRDDDALTGADGLHLSEEGREVLATMIGRAVGAAPSGNPDAITGCENVGDSGGDGDESDDGGGSDTTDSGDGGSEGD